MRLTQTLQFLCVTVFLSVPALAQDNLTVEEIVDILDRQMEVFKAAETGDLGKTRGLKLVTVQDVDAEPAAAQTGASVTAQADPAPTDPNAPIAAAADPDAPLVFGQLPAELQINLRIKFGFDSAVIAESQKPMVDRMCMVLQRSQARLVRIVGHSDASGSEDYNERLSMQRAREVARYLVEECGIAASRLETIGMGERFPFNTDDPRADENRRVEFQALG